MDMIALRPIRRIITAQFIGQHVNAAFLDQFINFNIDTRGLRKALGIFQYCAE